ncbi:MAG: hypothetical protein PVI88_00095 [Nitrosopumilaceae archaeon]
MENEKLYRIELYYAVFGIVVNVKDNIIVDAPPIARWMVGKPLAKIKVWVDKKNGTITKIK